MVCHFLKNLKYFNLRDYFNIQNFMIFISKFQFLLGLLSKRGGSILIFLSISFSFTNSANAQAASYNSPTYVFNLKDCIDYALKNQHDIKNAILNNRYSDEKIKENTAKLFPHININASFIQNLKLPTSLIPDFGSGNLNQKIPVQMGTRYNSSASGEIQQTLFNSNYFIGLQAAKVYREMSEKNLNANQVTTQVNVMKAYFNVLVNDEAIRIAGSNLDQLQKSLRDIKAKYDVGIAETIDVNRIEVQNNNATTGLANQQRLLKVSLYQLKFQMGMPQQDSLQLTETINDFAPDQLPPTDTFNFNLNDRPEYVMQQINNQLNALDLKSTRLSYLPTVGTYVNYGFNFFSPSLSKLYSNGFGSSAFGITLSFPIFSGTERIHQVNEAKITLEQSQNDLLNLEQQIRLEINNSYTDFLNNLASLNTQKTNMELTQGVYERIQYKYQQGVATSLDLLSAENELQQAQNRYIDALLNTLLSRIDLEKALGRIRTAGP